MPQTFHHNQFDYCNETCTLVAEASTLGLRDFPREFYIVDHDGGSILFTNPVEDRSKDEEEELFGVRYSSQIGSKALIIND